MESVLPALLPLFCSSETEALLGRTPGVGPSAALGALKGQGFEGPLSRFKFFISGKEGLDLEVRIGPRSRRDSSAKASRLQGDASSLS